MEENIADDEHEAIKVNEQKTNICPTPKEESNTKILPSTSLKEKL